MYYWFTCLKHNSLFSFDGTNLKWNYATFTAVLLGPEFVSLCLCEKCLPRASSDLFFLPR